MRAPAAAALARSTGAAFVFAFALAAPAHAGLPAAYQPTVISPQGPSEHNEFDLSAVVQRARRENKPLYLYLGASDCPYCRRYEAFLDRNAKELVPHFGGYLVVDLRSRLAIQAKALFIRVGTRSQSYADFLRELGDERARQLVYPSVWLLSPELKPLMQMPAGTGTFETVDEQLEILQLVQ